MATENYMLSAKAVQELADMRAEITRLRAFVGNIRGTSVRRTPTGINIDSPARIQPHESNEPIWFKITGKYDNNGTGKGYPWVRASADGTGAPTTPDSDQTGNYLFDVNGNKGLMSGQYVRVVPIAVTSNGDTVYLAIPAIPHALFPVKVTQSGGSDGDKTDAATWTYTVKTVDDAYTLSTSAMTPEWARASKGPMVKATHGTAYYTSVGVFTLYQVDEQEDSTTCVVSG